MILHEKKAFWVSVCHVINTDAAVMWFGHYINIAWQRSTDPGGLGETSSMINIF